MSKPPVPPVPFTWCTDDLYPAGPESYAETSTRVQPVSGKIAIGWKPKEKPPAQTFNWMFRAIADWLAWHTSKLVSRELTLGHMSFVGTDGSGSAIEHTSGGYATLSGFGNFYAPVVLPVGAKIESVTVFYDRGAGGTITPRLQYVTLATGVIDDVVIGTGDTTDDGIESQTLDAADHVVVAGRAYHIAVTAGSPADNKLFGASIVYSDDA